MPTSLDIPERLGQVRLQAWVSEVTKKGLKNLDFWGFYDQIIGWFCLVATVGYRKN